MPIDTLLQALATRGLAIAAQSAALPDAGGAEGAPEWIEIMPAGVFHGVDGRGPGKYPRATKPGPD